MNKQKKNKRKKNKRKKKELRNRSNGNDDDTSIIGTAATFDDDTMCDILSRLSTKTLMRFKCVCKRWCSLIQNDQYLIDSHFSRSKNLPVEDTNKVLFISSPSDAELIYSPYKSSDKDLGRKTFLFFSYLVEGRIVNSSKLDLDYPGYVKLLKPVNGLVCLCRYDTGSVIIYNPSTGERTSWIESQTSKEKLIEGGIKRAWIYYGFGFDPATNEHKVIRIWKIFQQNPDLSIDNNNSDDEDDGKYYITHDYGGYNEYEEVEVCRFCEVLTVGENRWRRIDEEVPRFLLASCQDVDDSIYANGSIFWRFRYETEVLVAFDVGQEKFRVISIPDFVIDPRSYKFSQTVELMELDGRIALVKWESSGLATLWKFDDDNKENRITSNDDSEWTKEEWIDMPSMWNGKYKLLIEAIAGTDLLILCEEERLFYYYTRKKNICKKFKIAYDDIKGLRWITNFIESLLPVQKHKHHHTHQQPPQLGN